MTSHATINTLVTKVRTRADVVGSSSFDDSVELKPWIRDSLQQLHETVVQRYNDFYVSKVCFSLSAYQDCYALPADFRQLQDCFLYTGPNAARIRLTSFNSEESASGNTTFGYPLCYRLMRNSIFIMPAPTVDGHNAVQLLYTPSFRPPANDYVTIDDTLPSGWDEWVVLDVIQKMNVKVRLLNMDDILKSKASVEERIVRGSYHRNAEAPRMKNRYTRKGMAGTGSLSFGPAYYADV